MPYFLLALTYTYTFLNGYNDGGNVVATIVASRAMGLRRSLLFAAVVELIAPVLFSLVFGSAVAATMGRNIVLPSFYTDANAHAAMIFIAAAILAAICWGMFALKMRLPSSSTHALIGGLVGAGLAAWGPSSVDWMSLLTKVLPIMLLAPVVGFFTSFLIMHVVRRLVYTSSPLTNAFIRSTQRVNLAALAALHSANDAQKSVGIVMLILAIAYPTLWPTGTSAPFYLILGSSVALALGICFSGSRIVRTVGMGIYRVKPIHSFSSQLSSSIIIAAATFTGTPVASSHIVSSTILGIGATEHVRSVKWGVVQNMLVSWIITIPSSACVGAMFYFILKLF